MRQVPGSNPGGPTPQNISLGVEVLREGGDTFLASQQAKIIEKKTKYVGRKYESRRVSIVATVLNEARTINALLLSITAQTKKPDEVIIVDGGSRDETVANIENFMRKHVGFPLKLITGRLSRPAGRNIAVEAAKHEIIAIVDAGCELDRQWLMRITEPFLDKTVDVVSGYYVSLPSSIFERCVSVYTLVMPDKVSSSTFLPSARSMAIKKSVWRQARGFPEKYPRNEDYVFAHTLKKMGKRFHFAKYAVVYWKPRENLKEAFHMFYSFARGDAQAGILRPKVSLIFFRYFCAVTLALLLLFTKSYVVLHAFSLLLCSYILWAILKNYTYINHWQAVFFLPMLQFCSDIAVVIGTFLGTLERSAYETH